MRLELESGKMIPIADDAALEEALRGLDGGDNSFLILIDDAKGNWFMQTKGGPDLFDVEYREETEDRHFRAKDDLSFTKTLEIFLAYLQQDKSYQRAVEWLPLNELAPVPKEPSAETEKPGCLPVVILVVALAGTVSVLAATLG